MQRAERRKAFAYFRLECQYLHNFECCMGTERSLCYIASHIICAAMAAVYAVEERELGDF